MLSIATVYCNNLMCTEIRFKYYVFKAKYDDDKQNEEREERGKVGRKERGEVLMSTKMHTCIHTYVHIHTE